MRTEPENAVNRADPATLIAALKAGRHWFIRSGLKPFSVSVPFEPTFQ